MLNFFTHIPLFVWPLFAFLLMGGLKARKTSHVPLKMLLLIPAGFFVWSVISFFGRYACNPVGILLWVLCLAVGFALGFFHMQRLSLQFDREKKSVELPGSWIPLLLSMSIFTAKFSVNMMRAMQPHLESSFLFLGLELFSTIILGVFAGRGVGCLLRYRSSQASA